MTQNALLNFILIGHEWDMNRVRVPVKVGKKIWDKQSLLGVLWKSFLKESRNNLFLQRRKVN